MCKWTKEWVNGGVFFIELSFFFVYSATYGSVHVYNKAYDRVNTKNEKMLSHIDRVKYDTTTSEDPVIQKYMQESNATVFATDAVLSLLMCATRTVYPWDIIVKKTADGKVILNKRPGGVFDFVTVNENSYDPPTESDKDTINSWSSLCNEATYINQNFSRQVLDTKSVEKFENPNPFATADTQAQLASCGYRYREFDMTSADAPEDAEKINMIVRRCTFSRSFFGKVGRSTMEGRNWSCWYRSCIVSWCGRGGRIWWG